MQHFIQDEQYDMSDAVRCTTTLVNQRTLAPFIDAAMAAYDRSTPSSPPTFFAILVGKLIEETAEIAHIEFARNVRPESPVALEEFKHSVVPLFGEAYQNPCRGYWCDPADLLRIQRHADRCGLDVLGSIHLHPDWHRIGPPDERGHRVVSQRPSPMDVHMFRNCGWPLNVICYMERLRQGPFYRLGAWSHIEDQSQPCREIEINVRIER